MSNTDLEQAFDLIAQHPSMAIFAGPRPPSLMNLAERALGGSLPASYRAFVEKFGAGGFGSFEVYGVIDDDFQRSSVPNGVWLTLNERRESGLPTDLAIVGSTGDGDYYCVRLDIGSDGPVFVYEPGYPAHQQRNEQIAPSFGSFLLEGVKASLDGEAT